MATRNYFLEEFVDPAGIGCDESGQPPAALNARGRLTRAIHEMLGICKGVLADGLLVDSEIQFLTGWFHANSDAVTTFPGKQIYTRLSRMYADGVVTDEERQELQEILARATGRVVGVEYANTVAETGVKPMIRIANTSTTLPFEDPEPEVVFTDQRFSFTGKFLSGTRSWCVEQVVRRGARFDPKPIAGTDYLVIGALGSRDWAHTSFGRKIEAAMSLKPRLKIISEQHFTTHLT